MKLRLSYLFLLLILSIIGCTERNSGTATHNTSQDIEIKNMKLIPEIINTTENSTVTLNIKSDTNGSMHIHGYNIESVLSKNKVTTIEINLNATGGFPIALHHSDSDTDHSSHGSHDSHSNKESNNNLDNHGELFESDMLMGGESFEYKIPNSLSNKSIVFHDHMTHSFIGKINIMKKGTPSTEYIFFENEKFSPSQIMIAPGSKIIWENKSQERMKIVSGSPPSGNQHDHGSDEEDHNETIIGKLIVNPK